jgi:hypothetical protein
MSTSSVCPLCGTRKAKRECPALQRTICPVCCGTKRLKEINCPDDCVYLTSSTAHPPAVVQRRQDRDLRFFLPLVSELSEPQLDLLLFFLDTVLDHAAAASPAVLDVDVADGASAVALTLETARKGVIYQHEPDSVPAQRLAGALRNGFAALGRQSPPPPRLEQDSIVALRVMERGARTAGSDLAGDPPPVYLELARRLRPGRVGTGGDHGSRSGLITPSSPGSSIIIP